MSLTTETIAKYPGDVWIETGCGGGETLRAARRAGYKKLFGCDLRKDLIDIAKKIARNIKVEVCDSPKFLERKLVQESKGGQRVTIFLDAHKTDEEDLYGTYPLRKEIQTICMYARSRPLVMIDDMRLFRQFGVDEAFFFDQMKKIGRYVFHTESSNTNIGDVLVCRPLNRERLK